MLVTIASRGYRESGVGAEARFGEGIIGVVAEARKPIRISGLLRGMLYALRRAASARRKPASARTTGASRCRAWRNPESQLGVPLLVRGELVGVLCIESEVPYRFHEEDKAVHRAARQLPGDCHPEHAAAGAGRERAGGEPAAAPVAAPAAGCARRDRARTGRHEVVYYARRRAASWSTAST